VDWVASSQSHAAIQNFLKGGNPGFKFEFVGWQDVEFPPVVSIVWVDWVRQQPIISHSKHSKIQKFKNSKKVGRLKNLISNSCPIWQDVEFPPVVSIVWVDWVASSLSHPLVASKSLKKGGNPDSVFKFESVVWQDVEFPPVVSIVWVDWVGGAKVALHCGPMAVRSMRMVVMVMMVMMVMMMMVVIMRRRRKRRRRRRRRRKRRRRRMMMSIITTC
jgi:hypothetical protein